jgi:hypothetical protein
LQNFPGSIERKSNADGFAFAIQIVEHDTIGSRRDLFQPEGIGRERLEPGPPVAFQRSPARIGVSAIALAFQAGIGRIQIEQRAKVVAPAGVEPIDDNGDLIDTLVSHLGRVRHVHWLHLARFDRERQRSMAIVVNGH